MKDLEVKFNVITDAHCKVIIEDNSDYLKENYNGTKLKYSESSSIIILLHNKTNDTVVKAPLFDHHTSKYIEVPIQFDGWFTINYIVLPKKEWIDKNKNWIQNSYEYVYYVDGNNVYLYKNGESYLVDVAVLLEINPEISTFSRNYKDYISICFLQRCYINLCLLIFNSRGLTSCWNKNTVDSELVFKRDLVWMAINIIKYLTEFNLLAEVERILEIITSCNGLCKFNTTTKSSNSGCGCSK